MTWNHRKARGASAQDTVETWDVPNGVVVREGAGPVAHKGGLVVLLLMVERSHLTYVPLLVFRLGETQSSEEGESAVPQGEKC